MNVVELPKTSILDVVTGLRNLADEIEAGHYGEISNLAWVMDGNEMTFGLLGKASSPDALFIMMMEIGKHELIERFKGN